VFPGLIARPLRASLILLLLVAVGAGFWLWSRAGESTAADPDAAVRDFREAAGGGAGPRPGVPRAGVYRLRQSGTERGGVGPIDLTRDLPDVALYTVTPAPGGYREELDISEEHVESSLLRVGKAGATRRVSTRTKVTFLGVGRDDRRELRPAPLRFPARLAVGDTWSSRYTAGTLPITVRSRVLRRDAVEIDGRRLPAVVVRTITDTGGTHPGRRTDVIWWSVPRALPLRWSIDTEIRGIAKLRTRAELALETLAPRV
jgi:hypothetical protein